MASVGGRVLNVVGGLEPVGVVPNEDERSDAGVVEYLVHPGLLTRTLVAFVLVFVNFKDDEKSGVTLDDEVGSALGALEIQRFVVGDDGDFVILEEFFDCHLLRLVNFLDFGCYACIAEGSSLYEEIFNTALLASYDSEGFSSSG